MEVVNSALLALSKQQVFKGTLVLEKQESLFSDRNNAYDTTTSYTQQKKFVLQFCTTFLVTYPSNTRFLHIVSCIPEFPILVI